MGILETFVAELSSILLFVLTLVVEIVKLSWLAFLIAVPATYLFVWMAKSEPRDIPQDDGTMLTLGEHVAKHQREAETKKQEKRPLDMEAYFRGETRWM